VRVVRSPVIGSSRGGLAPRGRSGAAARWGRPRPP